MGAEKTAVQVAGLDGDALKKALTRSQSRRRLFAFAVVVPPLLFILVAFVYPIGAMFTNGFYDPTARDIIPQTSRLLADWQYSDTLPSEEVYRTFAAELTKAYKDRTMGRLGTRLNFEQAGALSVLKSTARKADKFQAPYKDAFIRANAQWANKDMWLVMQRVTDAVSAKHFLASFDLEYDVHGSIVVVEENQRLYVKIFLKTLWMSLIVSVAALLMGFPVAHLLATVKRRHANMLIILVLLPFWTSLLVRTTSWMVLLQRNGVLNDILVGIGLVDTDNRLSMMFNLEGTIVAMTQILLPFAILPMYSVMRTISPSYMRAARSLGATQAYAFFRVYLPCTLPGVGAGVLLVFILSIGYYITPALLGGDEGMMISNFIAFHMQKTLNWGLAAALATVTLAGVILLYWLYDKVVGLESLKLG